MRWWWDCFVLDQHAELDFHSASSLKQQSADRHVAPLGHIIQSCLLVRIVCIFHGFWVKIRTTDSHWKSTDYPRTRKKIVVASEIGRSVLKRSFSIESDRDLKHTINVDQCQTRQTWRTRLEIRLMRMAIW
jgi:hypothetical protein